MGRRYLSKRRNMENRSGMSNRNKYGGSVRRKTNRKVRRKTNRKVRRKTNRKVCRRSKRYKRSKMRGGSADAEEAAPAPYKKDDVVLYTDARTGNVLQVSIDGVSTNVPLGEEQEISIRMPDGTVRDTVLARLAPAVAAVAVEAEASSSYAPPGRRPTVHWDGNDPNSYTNDEANAAVRAAPPLDPIVTMLIDARDMMKKEYDNAMELVMKASKEAGEATTPHKTPASRVSQIHRQSAETIRDAYDAAASAIIMMALEGRVMDDVDRALLLGQVHPASRDIAKEEVRIMSTWLKGAVDNLTNIKPFLRMAAAEIEKLTKKELTKKKLKKNYVIYFDDNLDYFTRGGMTWITGGNWYGLYSSQNSGGIYRKIIDENNEIIGIPVCCAHIEITNPKYPYYIAGKQWPQYKDNTDNVLRDKVYPNSSIPPKMFETLLEACNKCKIKQPDYNINLAFDWDQCLTKFDGLPTRGYDGDINYSDVIKQYEASGGIHPEDINHLKNPSVMCDYLFNGASVDSDNINNTTSRRFIIQEVLTELWDKNVSIVIISQSFYKNKLYDSGPKMFMDIMFEMGIWKNYEGRNFNINDESRKLCLIGNSSHADTQRPEWKVDKLEHMLTENKFNLQRGLRLNNE